MGARRINNRENTDIEYRHLIQSYKSTQELADAYNTALNPHREHLLKVARAVIERYKGIKNPSILRLSMRIALWL